MVTYMTMPIGVNREENERIDWLNGSKKGMKMRKLTIMLFAVSVTAFRIDGFRGERRRDSFRRRALDVQRHWLRHGAFRAKSRCQGNNLHRSRCRQRNGMAGDERANLRIPRMHRRRFVRTLGIGYIFRRIRPLRMVRLPGRRRRKFGTVAQIRLRYAGRCRDESADRFGYDCIRDAWDVQHGFHDFVRRRPLHGQSPQHGLAGGGTGRRHSAGGRYRSRYADRRCAFA